MERKPQPSATAGRACCKWARTLSVMGDHVLSRDGSLWVVIPRKFYKRWFHWKSSSALFEVYLISEIAWRHVDAETFTVHQPKFLLFFSDIQEVVFCGGLVVQLREKTNISCFCPFFPPSVADQPSPCWLSICTLLAWGCMRALLFGCVTWRLFAPDSSRIPSFFLSFTR